MASTLDLTKEYQYIKGSTCSICEENTSDIQLINCLHNFCSSCISKYTSIKIQEGEVLSLKCPAIECPQLLDPDQIKSLLPAELYSKYEAFKQSKINESNVDFRWCPRLNCQGYDIKHNSNHLTCQLCKNSFCFLCSEDWHEGNCENLKKLKQKDLKPCPRCSVLIEKNHGCPEISCAKCKYRFCWLCSQSMTNHSLQKCFMTSRKNIFYWVVGICLLFIPVVLIFFIPFSLLFSIYLDETGSIEKKYKNCYKSFIIFGTLLSPVLLPPFIITSLITLSTLLTLEFFNMIKSNLALKILFLSFFWLISFTLSLLISILIFLLFLLTCPVLGLTCLAIKTLLLFIK